jgi:nucleotide-binding universal stress UspA family protein
MVDKLEAYVAPLRAEGVEVSPILRVGHPREVIVEVATSLKAELLILGSHSKRGLLDIVLGRDSPAGQQGGPVSGGPCVAPAGGK